MMASGSSRVRGPRNFLRVFICLAAVFLLVGCEPASQSFLSRGIGANLPTSEADMTRTHNLQRQYFNYLCQEAGLAGAAYGGPPGTCHIGAVDSTTWTLIVQQGLNDIDRRCDAYLQWLDNRKRSNGPLINQITSIGAATTGIMGITGATTEALTIAALAFGLAVQSVENYNGLLLRIDSSTVNSVVLNARHRFRQNIQGKQFSNKPEVEYVLRSYLRLCLPFAIETNINDYSTFGSAGITPDESNTINQTPIAGAPVGSQNRAGRGGGTGSGQGRTQSDDENQTVVNMYGRNSNMQLQSVYDDQKRLCISEAGAFGDKTRTAIAIYRRTQANDPTPALDGSGPFYDLSDPQQRVLYRSFLANPETGDNCETDRFINYWEASKLKDETQVKDFTDRANALGIEGVDLKITKTTNGKVTLNDPTFRKMIGILRGKLAGCGLTEEIYDKQNHITRNLDFAVDEATDNAACFQ